MRTDVPPTKESGVIPFAPWCRPRERLVADNRTTKVYVTTTYGYHAIAALLYALWRKVCR